MRSNYNQNYDQTVKTSHFLAMASPIVVEIVKSMLRTNGCQIEQKGSGLGLALSIKKDEKEAEFYLQNLLLEIATIDRDETPLRLDENLRDFDYFLAKMVRIVESKLNVLLHLFGEEDVEAAIAHITKDAKQYERIRIWRFDQKKAT